MENEYKNIDLVNTENRLYMEHATVAEKDAIINKQAQEIKRLKRAESFYRRRCEELQHIQSKMRDPERQAVCEILANGSTVVKL